MAKYLIPAALTLASVLALAGCGSAGSHPVVSPGSQAVTHSPQAPAASRTSPSAVMLAADLKAAGLDITRLIVYTAATDPNHLLGRQNGYTSKMAWQDPRAAKADAGDTRGSIGLGGGIEVYPSAAGAQARRAYLAGFTPPLGDGYDYVSGTAVLRLSQYLTPAQAHAYQKAFSAAAQRG